MFRKWDIDGNGSVSKSEFSWALPALGLPVTSSEVESLFDTMDTNKSGDLQLEELQRQLAGRSAKRAATGEREKASATRSIEHSSKLRHGLRTGAVDQNDSNLLQGFHLDESSDAPYGEQVSPSF